MEHKIFTERFSLGRKKIPSSWIFICKSSERQVAPLIKKISVEKKVSKKENELRKSFFMRRLKPLKKKIVEIKKKEPA